MGRGRARSRCGASVVHSYAGGLVERWCTLTSRRQQLIEAATELFARRGYAGTSMQDIADAVGIRKPSLYKFFSSKDDLYGAVLESTLAPLAEAIDDVLGGGRSTDGADLTATSLRAPA